MMGDDGVVYLPPSVEKARLERNLISAKNALQTESENRSFFERRYSEQLNLATELNAKLEQAGKRIDEAKVISGEKRQLETALKQQRRLNYVLGGTTLLSLGLLVFFEWYIPFITEGDDLPYNSPIIEQGPS